MTSPEGSISRRSRVVTALLVVALLAVAFACRKQLTAWFTGENMGTVGAEVATRADGFALDAALDPDPPALQGNALVLDVRDRSGKPVVDAKVAVDYEMPAMGSMAQMQGSAEVASEGDGRYRARFDLPMRGSYTLKARIRTAADSANQEYRLTVGTKGLSATSSSSSAGASAAGPDDKIDHYTCSMHPFIKQPAPGKCPICGMSLVPVTKKQQAEGVVVIDEARRQLIGVRTGPVIEAPMKRSFRAVGRVAYDESSLTDVNLKVSGWITKLFVSQTGQHVSRGQALFMLYSPDLYSAQQDYLLAIHGARANAAAPNGYQMEQLGRAARKRLSLLGLSEQQIDKIAASSEPFDTIPIVSPASGFVIEKDVVEGASVQSGMRLLRIAALDKVWVEAEVYEGDLAHVHVGQSAKVTLDYLPDHTYDAKVSYVYPYLESAARTGRVRIELPNKAFELRPGMYASVELSAEVGTRVQVPASAVVYTGPRRLVFVDLGEGRFKPQEVRVGVEANGMYEVLDGLEPGDVVATSGLFLIAAEARISTAAKYWDNEAPHAEGQPSTAPATPAPSAAPPSAAPAKPSAVYTCPMHPDVRRDTPGKCPKCGMELVPVPTPKVP